MTLASWAKAPSTTKDRAGYAYAGSTNCTKKATKNRIAFGLNRLMTNARRKGRSSAPGAETSCDSVRSFRVRHMPHAARSMPTASQVR